MPTPREQLAEWLTTNGVEWHEGAHYDTGVDTIILGYPYSHATGVVDAIAHPGTEGLVTGYGGFFTTFGFHPDGTLKEVGIWE